VPTLGELYGMAPLVHGNDALRPESGVVVDGGVRAKHRALYASATGFLRFADDLIGFVRSAQGFALPENIAKARVAGLELQAGARLFGFAFVEGTATFLDPRDVSPDRRTVNSFLPFQSALVVSPRIGAEWRPRGLAWLGRLRGELRWNHQSSRYADAAGLAVIPEQDSLDAEVMAQLPDERASLRVRMTDLTDAPRWDVVGFPLPGRSLFVSLEAQW
jgi:iron complex outermembrane receptor protein